MIIQYPAKIAVALLVALVARLGNKANAGKGVSPEGFVVGREALRSWAARYAVRLKALSSSIGDARTMMRLLGESVHPIPTPNHPHPLIRLVQSIGIIPVLASIPSLLSTASSTDPTSHIINILQTVSLIIYYPLENLSYLSSKGVFPLSATRELNWSTWSCRFWAVYVALDIWRLARQKKQMQVKERAIRMRMQGEGKEDVEADVKALRAEKIGWIEEAVVNVYVHLFAPILEMLLISSSQRICAVDHTLVVAERRVVERGESFSFQEDIF